jgi:hypothetical protein
MIRSSTCSSARTGSPAAIRQQALALEVGELGVDRGRGREADRIADLADGGGVAALPDRALDEVEDPLLPGGDVRHGAYPPDP